MTDCSDLTIVWSSLGIAVVVLIIHRRCGNTPRVNREGVVNPEDPYERFFRYNDVCNFRTYSHEMIIIPLWIVGFMCGVIQWSMECVHVVTNVVFGVVYFGEFLFVFCMLLLQDTGRDMNEMDDL